VDSDLKQNIRGATPETWLVPLVILIFCGFTYWLTTEFARMPPILKRGIQPSDFPQLLIALMVGLTALIVWKDPIRVSERIQNPTLKAFGIIGVFVLLVQLDFFFALAVSCLGLTLLWKKRDWYTFLIVGFFVPIGVFFLFDQVFEVRFPRGFLTNVWYG